LGFRVRKWAHVTDWPARSPTAPQPPREKRRSWDVLLLPQPVRYRGSARAGFGAMNVCTSSCFCYSCCHGHGRFLRKVFCLLLACGRCVCLQRHVQEIFVRCRQADSGGMPQVAPRPRQVLTQGICVCCLRVGDAYVYSIMSRSFVLCRQADSGAMPHVALT